MELISFPFRLAPNGTIATVDQDTDDARIEAVAVLVLTRKGERTLAPDYGISDPAFEGIDLAEVTVGLIDYGPTGVEVAELDTEPVDDRTARTTLTINIATDDVDDDYDDTPDEEN